MLWNQRAASLGSEPPTPGAGALTSLRVGDPTSEFRGDPVRTPGQAKRSVKVHKALTTIGADAENDIALGRAGLEPTHAQITKEADGWWISALAKDLTINGRREKRRRLAEGDVLRLGELTLTFLESDPPAISQPPSDEPAVPSRGHKSITATREVVTAYRRIYEFSVKLMANAGTGALVETLLDSVIELTGADKGFLVLVGDEQGQRSRRRAGSSDPTSTPRSPSSPTPS
jgi:pSer/pThr/pTyr-binding forkhead associated (FHA) protein